MKFRLSISMKLSVEQMLVPPTQGEYSMKVGTGSKPCIPHDRRKKETDATITYDVHINFCKGCKEVNYAKQ